MSTIPLAALCSEADIGRPHHLVCDSYAEKTAAMIPRGAAASPVAPIAALSAFEHDTLLAQRYGPAKAVLGIVVPTCVSKIATEIDQQLGVVAMIRSFEADIHVIGHPAIFPCLTSSWDCSDMEGTERVRFARSDEVARPRAEVELWSFAS